MFDLDETKDYLKSLIGFSSVSRIFNLNLFSYISAFMSDCGADLDAVDFGQKPKKHLIATMGPRDRKGGLVLSGHMDVVTVENQDWDTNPWELVEKDGRLIGRGTADMKGYLACMMTLARNLSGEELFKPVSFVFSCDEEISGTAIDPALQKLALLHPAPELCILGEPTSMQVAYAHKARVSMEVTATGTGGHPSMIDKEGITSAHVLMTDFETALNRREGARLRALLGNARTVGPASYVTTYVRNGEASNSIPAKEVIHVDMRARPGVSWKEVREAFRPVAAQVSAAYRAEKKALARLTINGKVLSPGFFCQSEDALKLGTGLAQGGLMTADFVCEAPNYIKAGFSETIICGPGADFQAHKPNESIGLEDLARCNAMMQRICDYVCKGKLPGLVS